MVSDKIHTRLVLCAVIQGESGRGELQTWLILLLVTAQPAAPVSLSRSLSGRTRTLTLWDAGVFRGR